MGHNQQTDGVVLGGSMNSLIAIFLYKIGIKPQATHDIANNLSLGYGELDENGFWQFQLPNKYRK